MPKVVVVGAGISGLVAARVLADAGCEVVVVEKQPRLGGRVLGVDLGGEIVDAGASHVWSFYRTTRIWLNRLGLGAQLVAVPAGRLAITAGDLPGILGSAALVARHWGRLDYTHPEKAAPLDSNSIAGYAGRHLSPRFTEVAIRPAFEWNAFCELEDLSQALLLQSGRLFLGARPQVLRGGLQRLAWGLARGLTVRLGKAGEAVLVASHGDGVTVTMATGDPLEAAAAVISTEPGAAAALIGGRGARTTFLRGVRHSEVARGWWDFPAHPQDPAVGVVPGPRGSGAVLAGRTARGRLRVAVALYRSGDGQLGGRRLEASLRERGLALDPRLLARQPTAFASHVWPRAVTIFGPGHFRLLAGRSPEEPGQRVWLAGDYLVSPTIEGAVLSGQSAASGILRSHILEGG